MPSFASSCARWRNSRRRGFHKPGEPGTGRRSAARSPRRCPRPATSPRLLDFPGLDHIGQHRALGIGQHHLDVWRDAREIARQAGQRAAAAHAHHHGVEHVVALLPDLRTGGRLVRQRVGGIGELIDVEAVGYLARQSRGQVLIVLGMALADIAARQADLRAERAQMQNLLLRHLVRDHQQQPVALLRRHQRQPQPGVAGGRLDEGAGGSPPGRM